MKDTQRACLREVAPQEYEMVLDIFADVTKVLADRNGTRGRPMDVTVYVG